MLGEGGEKGTGWGDDCGGGCIDGKQRNRLLLSQE